MTDELSVRTNVEVVWIKPAAMRPMDASSRRCAVCCRKFQWLNRPEASHKTLVCWAV